MATYMVMDWEMMTMFEPVLLMYTSIDIGGDGRQTYVYVQKYV